MAEPKEFQGVNRAELIRQVVRHRDLRRQTEAQCTRSHSEREAAKERTIEKHVRLVRIAEKLGLDVDDDLAEAVGALVDSSIAWKAAVVEWQRVARGSREKYDRLAQWSTAAALLLEQLARTILAGDADRARQRPSTAAKLAGEALGLVENLPGAR